MYQGGDIILDSLFCGKKRKISKSRCDIDLGRTLPNVELLRIELIPTELTYTVLQYQDWNICNSS